MKSVALTVMPHGVVMVIFPVVAPLGTVAVICVDELTAKIADRPLNLTDKTPPKLPPVRVTVVPGKPLLGVKLLMNGPTTVGGKNLPNQASSKPIGVPGPGPSISPSVPPAT